MAGQKGEAMKKRLGGLVLLAALGGCVNSQPGSYMSNVGPGGAPVTTVACAEGADVGGSADVGGGVGVGVGAGATVAAAAGALGVATGGAARPIDPQSIALGLGLPCCTACWLAISCLTRFVIAAD